MIRYHRHSETAAAKVEATPRCVRTLEERMADDMRELAFSGQNVSVETLIGRGWTAKTVRRLIVPASAIARRSSIRQTVGASVADVA